ncbi:MAG TPA: hypothetical protein VHT71_06865, partial [Methylomirabilota bacterium]|nr:hypothetical protein [Methylomirabilota bacterium]
MHDESQDHASTEHPSEACHALSPQLTRRGIEESRPSPAGNEARHHECGHERGQQRYQEVRSIAGHRIACPSGGIDRVRMSADDDDESDHAQRGLDAALP